METIDAKINELRERKERFKKGGGIQAIKSQHEKGKLTARERLNLLLDPNSFMEFDLLATQQCTDFGFDEVEGPTDGAIIGCGKVDGRRVFIYAPDYTVMGGSMGEAHAKKLIKIMDAAGSVGSPLIMLNDSGGGRPQEQHKVIESYQPYFYKHTQLSGVIPQITLVMGPVAGGPCYGPALTDFIFMVNATSFMFIGGPPVVKAITKEDVTAEQLGGARIHSEISGVADLVLENDEQCLKRCRELLSFLPANSRENPPKVHTGDDPCRLDDGLAKILPDSRRTSYDMHKIINRIVDNGYFFELKPEFARNLITGFARLDGQSVGIVANQPMVLGGALDIDSADKASRFVMFCDAFNIPILFLVDCPAYLVGTKMEYGGIIRHGAKLLYAVSEATVPKITLVVGKAFAGGRVAMGSKDLKADLVFAWPTAEIALLGMDAGMSILLRNSRIKERIAQADNPQQEIEILERQYKDKFLNFYKVLPIRHVDDIIEPRESRAILIKALDSLQGKQVIKPWKKHGVMPV